MGFVTNFVEPRLQKLLRFLDIVRKGLSVNCDNFYLDAISIISVFVIFKVRLSRNDDEMSEDARNDAVVMSLRLLVSSARVGASESEVETTEGARNDAVVTFKSVGRSRECEVKMGAAGGRASGARQGRRKTRVTTLGRRSARDGACRLRNRSGKDRSA